MSDDQLKKTEEETYLAWHADTLERQTFWYSHTVSETSAWGMETIKHLALVSLAGLTGTFALLSTNHMNRADSIIAGGGFALASILCCLSLYFGHLNRSLYAAHIRKTIQKLYAHTPLIQSDIDQPKSVKRIGHLSEILGWLSAIAIIGSVGILFWSIS